MEHWHRQSGAYAVQAVINAPNKVRKAEEDVLADQLRTGTTVNPEGTVARVLQLQTEMAQRANYRPSPNRNY
jgi:hypothetical protein